ncbi:MAG TPA: CAAX prenyl protease-related protein [Bryobacteraceae bacterium]|nr:CAAX prenyl protease-related protein [Bryobacteraceae bacterium]
MRRASPSPIKSLPYIAPFLSFLGLLELYRILPLPELFLQAAFVAIMAAVLVAIARPALKLHDLHIRNWPGTVFLGILVFAIWIAPDTISSGYRHFWLFENPLTGTAQPGLDAAFRSQPGVLWIRAIRAAVIVPIVEELFWRAWLMRWLLASDFESVPLGASTPRVFWIVAVLFAAEHGAYWDVGLAAGILYNWWMTRTKSLGDLILAHAVTNACLSLYVVMAGKWAYWS